MSFDEIKQFRTTTGWGLSDCKAALVEYGGLQKAEHEYQQAISVLRNLSAAYKAALSSDYTKEWWNRDFMSRPSAELTSHQDPLLKKWGKERADFDAFTKERLAPPVNSFSLFKESLKWVKATAGDEADYLGWKLWKHASSTHIVPTFEQGWLAALKEDPFQELRPLQRTGVAESILRRYSIFENPVTNERAKYIAEALSQAEQYYIASNAVNLETKPLLLYYMTTALVRAVLTIRLEHFIGRHGSHGLKMDSVGSGLAGQEVTPTKAGLFQALQEGLPGDEIQPLSGPWSLSALCKFIPELSEMVGRHSLDFSNCQQILKYSEHHHVGMGMQYNHHLTLVLPDSFLRRCGVTERTDEDTFKKQLKLAFPGSFWSLGHDHGVSETRSSLLDEQILALVHCAHGAVWQRRIYPLLHQGGLDGEWYAIYNQNHRPPHQLSVFYAALYALSMLVRYKPVDWSGMLSAPDATRAIIDRLCRVAAQKVPILASELLLGCRILGSTARIPH
jgi:hypothetical protein